MSQQEDLGCTDNQATAGMRKIGLASGVVKGLDPVATIHAAAAGGWDMVGLWVDPETWTDETTQSVLAELGKTRMPVIDVEVIRITPGPLDPANLRILDVGIAIGAANALVISDDPDMKATAEKFAALCTHVQDTKLRVNLEFGYWSEVKTISDANRVLDAVNHPCAAILVDILHLSRGGGTAADVAALPHNRVSYMQICDGPARGADIHDRKAIYQEAVWDRLHVGEGDLDVVGMIRALPMHIPLSVEMRSKALNDDYADPFERSRVTAEITRKFLVSV